MPKKVFRQKILQFFHENTKDTKQVRTVCGSGRVKTKQPNKIPLPIRYRRWFWPQNQSRSGYKP